MVYKEDIILKCRIFIVKIIKYIETLPIGNVKFSVGKQLIDSAGSIGANMVEARFARSPKEFVSSSRIALKEANETLFWLDTLQDLDLINSDVYDNLIQEVRTIARIISAIIRNYRRKHNL